MTWFEKIFYMAAIAVLAYFLIREGCKPVVKCPDVVVTPVTGGSDSPYTPRPQPTEEPVVTNPKHPTTGGNNASRPSNPNEEPTLTTPKPIKPPSPVDNVDICQEVNRYADTLKFGDDGYVVVKDTVLGRILRRSFSYSITSRTQIIREQEAKRFKLYAGVEFISPLNYGGAALIGQFKNESMIKIATGKMWNNSWQVGIGFYIPIKLRK